MKAIKHLVLVTALLLGTSISARAQEHDHSQHPAKQDQISGCHSEHGAMMDHGQMDHGQMMKGQKMHSQMGQGQHQHGQMMHGRMMQNPVMRAGMRVHLLPRLAEPLGLTQETVAALEKTRSRFADRQKAFLEQLAAKDAAVAEHARTNGQDLRNLLGEAAALRADYQALLLETATEMEAQLSPAEREKLDGLGHETLHPAMMAAMEEGTMRPMMAGLCPTAQSPKDTGM